MGCFPLLVLIFLSWQIGSHYQEIIQSQFWPNFGSDFAATVAGILIALWIDRKVRKNQENKEQKKVLKSIIDILNINSVYASQYKGLRSTQIFIQDMETTLLQGLIYRLSNFEIVNDPNLLLSINDSYNHILLLQNKINIQKKLTKSSLAHIQILSELNTDAYRVCEKINTTNEYITGLLHK